jgi:hypothetical protein
VINVSVQLPDSIGAVSGSRIYLIVALFTSETVKRHVIEVTAPNNVLTISHKTHVDVAPI